VKKAFDDNIVPMTWQIADSLHALLTAREMEVLNLMIHGNSYSQVADILEISNDTAKVHIRSIYYKLNVRKKSDAVKKAFGVEIVTETLNTNDSSQVIPPLPSFTTNEGIMA
jgi:DNA-binding CsgD family transcriptional regulator